MGNSLYIQKVMREQGLYLKVIKHLFGRNDA